MFCHLCQAQIFKTAFVTPGNMKEMTDRNEVFCSIYPMQPIY